ncbi:MAG TPA: hypothetical protein DIS62_01480 [Candidatus Kerfeldbacteria bacterium]|nr:hypothetical protein [Candidatus Kerfeldbacteria bacterium]
MLELFKMFECLSVSPDHMTTFNYEKLEVVQTGKKLVKIIYQVIEDFPKGEKYILAQQLQ